MKGCSLVMTLARWAAAVTVALAAAGRDVRADDDPAASVVSRLPASTRSVLVLQRLAEQIDNAGVSPVKELVRIRLIDKGVDAAWEGLAKRLGWTPREALERLLGARAVLALDEPPAPAAGGGQPPSRGKPGDPGVPWAVFSEVADDCVLKLAAALAGVPRRIERGRPVYALEGGQFLLAAGAKVQTAKGARTWLLLGPSEHAAWFDALLPVLVGDPPGPVLGQTRAFAELQRLGLGDVAVLSRVGTGADLSTWDGYVAASLRARGEGGGLRGVCTGYSAVLTYVNPASKETISSYPLVPETRFDWLGEDATAAVVQMSPARPGEVPFKTPAIPVFGFSVLGRELDPGAGGRSITVLRPDGATGRAIMIEVKRLAGAAEPETPHLDERIGVLVGGRGPGSASVAALALRGLAPGVARTLVFEPLNASPLRVLVGAPVAAAWVERPARPLTGTTVNSQGRDHGAEPGANGRWWAVAIAGVAARGVEANAEESTVEAEHAAVERAGRALRETLTALEGRAPPGGPAGAGQGSGGGGRGGGAAELAALGTNVQVMRRWVSLGRVRVQVFVRLLGIPIGPPEYAGLWGKIDSVSWSLWADEEGAVHGEAELGLTNAP
ncbi:MAG: hypothetical protein ACKVS8_14525 [Phycisphaerales bacterium]